jgi:hypothetical protein
MTLDQQLDQQAIYMFVAFCLALIGIGGIVVTIVDYLEGKGKK